MAIVTAEYRGISLTSRRSGKDWTEPNLIAVMTLSSPIPANAVVSSAKLTANVTQTPMSGAYIYLNGTAVRTTHSAHEIGVSINPGASDYSVACSFKGSGTSNTVSVVNFDLTLTVEYELGQHPSSFTLKSTTVKCGQNIEVTITPYRETYGHQLLCDFNGWQVATAVLQPGVNAATLQIPQEWLDSFPYATSATCTVTLRCWEGSNTYFFGYTTQTITITLPNNATPTIDLISLTRLLTIDGTTYPAVTDGYVQGKCGYSAEIKQATAKHGASIASYSISGGGYSTSGKSLKTGLLNTAGTNKITFRVIDTRGLTATKIVSINVQPYTAPKITELSAWRVDANGKTDDMGEAGQWLFDWQYSNLGDANTLTRKAYLKPSGGAESEIAIGVTQTNQSIKDVDGQQVVLSTEKRYVLRLELKDAYGKVSRSVEIPSANFAIHLNAKGNGICFGGASTVENAVEIAPGYDLVFKGQRNERLWSALDIYPVGTIFVSTSATSPAEKFGGTWKQLERRFLLGACTAYPANSFGGTEDVVLTTKQIPSHTHQFSKVPWFTGELTTGGNYLAERTTAVRDLVTYNTEATGGGGSHTNMPPYLSVYMWERIE